MDWSLAEVRPQYGPDWADPDAPLLPSERFDRDLQGLPELGRLPTKQLDLLTTPAARIAAETEHGCVHFQLTVRPRHAALARLL